jgi:uncharacterized protein
MTNDIMLSQKWLIKNLFPFSEGGQAHLFIADGSRIYDIDQKARELILEMQQGLIPGGKDQQRITNLLGELKLTEDLYIRKDIIQVPKLNSISINVAQVCNMSCGYCYANEGKFGGASAMMKPQIAIDAVDKLFSESGDDAPLLVGFMGGEPLLASELIHETVKYAWNKAQKLSKKIAFSITTNATLIFEADAILFSSYPFTVTVSIDGNEAVHNILRKMQNGKDSYQKVMNGLRLLKKHRPSKLNARVTVTPQSGRLLPLLDNLISLGFDDVGFSAVLVSPDKSYSFTKADFDRFTEHMIECGEHTLEEWKAGRPYPFGNFVTALEEIHKGTHRPYPCGAGAGYMSVNTKGDLYACHRLIDDPDFLMGNIYNAIDNNSRLALLENKQVDTQEPCNTCWARYLCGGGCYHEIKHRGRVACDYIRDWLSFCLSAYVHLSKSKQKEYS